MGSAWFFFIGLLLLGVAIFQMMQVRSFSFKNKKVLVREKITLLVGSAGFLVLFYGFLLAIF